MVFRFQYPGGNTTLLQALTDAAIDSTSGGAVFAWATVPGLNALFGNPDFESFVKRRQFSLIVGTDSITDTRAIERLVTLQETYPLLEVHALVNDEQSLFHPKLAWFVDGGAMTLILGSGNLTRGGLLGNWEAFTVTQHPTEDLPEFQLSIDDWLEDIDPGLLPLSDPRVLHRVAGNSGDERSVKRPAPRPEPVTVLENKDYTGWLVAELNKGRNTAAGATGFSQASFDTETFKKFFDYAGGEVDVVLWPVHVDGSLGALESRKGRYKTASVNYYFELGAAHGLPYPAVSRPIATFGRLAAGGYTYRVVLPGQPGHEELETWLAANAPAARPTFMRRAVLTTDQLRDAWAANPILIAQAPES